MADDTSKDIDDTFGGMPVPTVRRRKPALSRRGLPKDPDPVTEHWQRYAAEKFPEGAPDWLPTERASRDERGRYVKGTPSPNPHGRGAGRNTEPRMFGKSQAIKDMLELLEQPVTVRKGKVRKQVPAIMAIYDRMIHMAIEGDWAAIKKCVETREKYTDFREKTLGGLIESAQNVRETYKAMNKKMPADLRKFVEDVELRAYEGQYDAG